MLVIIIASFLLLVSASCTSVRKTEIRYSGKAPIYSAVAYVMELSSARLIKADIENNEYITSYIQYEMFGRVNRFRLYMTLRNQVFTTEIGDVQIQVSRGGFKSWQTDDVRSLVDVDVYTRTISRNIVRAAKEAKFENFKHRLQSDLEFNRIVLKDLRPERRPQWVAENMKNVNYRFNSKIERILKAKENKKYGKYLVKMSRIDADLRSHIKLEFYSNNPIYTQHHIGDALELTGRLVDASYHDTNDVLTILLSDSL